MRKLSSPSFTLIEIMIVVAVILVLAFMVIPSMLRANATSNEVSAMANLRSLYSGLVMYSANNNGVYPTQLSDMSSYISPVLASGEKSGYLFNYTRDSADEFHVNANPQTPGKTGGRYFYMDETNVIKYNESGEAGEDDLSAE